MELVGEKIVRLHGELRRSFPELSRMAVAVYDKDDGLLRTFVDSTVGHESIKHHAVPLEAVPSLKTLAEQRHHRVIDDLAELKGSQSEHTQWLLREGFRSSYTLPLLADDLLIGFLFFDADIPRYFDHIVTETTRLYAELISSVLLSEIAPLYTLRGALHAAQSLTHKRDIETAKHILRMSHYAHLLAKKLSAQMELTDEYVNYVLQYAPMHDIGKVGIPDEILLKPGKLTPTEFDVIKTHVQIGLDVVDMLVKEFNLAGFAHLEILRNTIAFHHERYDGSGYPAGVAGTDIPLEGRIAAVADVLDALCMVRPYKKAYTFDESVAYILENSGTHFDPACCEVLRQNKAEFEAVYQTFEENCREAR